MRSILYITLALLMTWSGLKGQVEVHICMERVKDVKILGFIELQASCPCPKLEDAPPGCCETEVLEWEVEDHRSPVFLQLSEVANKKVPLFTTFLIPTDFVNHHLKRVASGRAPPFYWHAHRPEVPLFLLHQSFLC